MWKTIRFIILSVVGSILVGIGSGWVQWLIALPPKEDTPEEILRMEILTAARSPIDGKPVSAAEYAQLQARLQESPPPKLNANIRQNVFLLRLRQSLRQIFPFLKF